MTTLPPIAVASLWRYPIKSCRGMSLPLADLDARGIIHDRRFMVTDPGGRFLTQREHPRLALISPQVSETCLTVSAPGMGDLQVPVATAGTETRVVVWRDTCAAIDQGMEVAGWFSSYLGHDVRLVRIVNGFTRRIDPAFARHEDDQVHFADGYPLLLISQASLDDLNSRLSAPLPMDRFRPNIVVSGCAPFAEDTWPAIRVGNVELDVVKPCARCVTTTVNQETAHVGKEPLATLATFRKRDRGVMFGQNLIHRGTGTIAVGDAISVLGTAGAAAG